MHIKSFLMILCLASGSLLSAPVDNSLDRRRIQNSSIFRGIFMGVVKFFARLNSTNAVSATPPQPPPHPPPKPPPRPPSWPPSKECRETIRKLTGTCSAEFNEFRAMASKFPKELKVCTRTNSCTLGQKQCLLKFSCPIEKKINDCFKPAIYCQLEYFSKEARDSHTKRTIECDAFSSSSGSTNITDTSLPRPVRLNIAPPRIN